MKAARRDKRRDEILDIATALLVEHGYRDTSMLEVARHASASKETLYAWFGDKHGLFEAVIHRNAETVQAVLARHLKDDAPLDVVLRDFGRALLRLLLGDGAVAINRAAIAEAQADPRLARILSRSGREATLPGFLQILEASRARKRLTFDSAKEAAEDYLGLLLGDLQIRRLLGLAPAPTKAQIEARVRHAAAAFQRLYET